MSDQAATRGPLTIIQLAALRRAESVSFRHDKGASTIWAKKRIPQSRSNPFGPQDQEVAFTVGARLVDYEKDSGILANPLDCFTAFEHLSALNFHDEWKTIAGLLHVGDDLTLEWRRSAWTSSRLREANLVGDVLALIVQRDKKRLAFFLSEQIADIQSAVRMIRRFA